MIACLVQRRDAFVPQPQVSDDRAPGVEIGRAMAVFVGSFAVTAALLAYGQSAATPIAEPLTGLAAATAVGVFVAARVVLTLVRSEEMVAATARHVCGLMLMLAVAAAFAGAMTADLRGANAHHPPLTGESGRCGPQSSPAIRGPWVRAAS